MIHKFVEGQRNNLLNYKIDLVILNDFLISYVLNLVGT